MKRRDLGNEVGELASLVDALLACHAIFPLRDEAKDRLQERLKENLCFLLLCAYIDLLFVILKCRDEMEKDLKQLKVRPYARLCLLDSKEEEQ